MKWQSYPEYKPSGVEWLGQIPAHWKLSRLKSIARFGYGESLADDARVHGEYDVFGSNGIVGQHDKPNTEGPCLVIGRKGSFGKVAYSERPCFSIDTTYFVDSTLTRNHLRWLFYCLQWLRLDSFSKDSAVPGLSREDAYGNVMPICSAEEQRGIAEFLDRETGRVDGLIETKQRHIELLQEKRAALITHAVTKGLDPNVPMKDSGIEWLGDVPENWTTVKFGRCAFFQEGPGLRNWQFTDEGVRVVCVTNITDSGIDFSNYEKFISESEYSQSYRHFTVSKGDLLLSSSGNSWGKVAEFTSDESSILNTSTIRINRNRAGMLCRPFLKWLLQAVSTREQLGLFMTGSCQPNFGPSHLARVLVPVPKNEEQFAIAEYLDNRIGRMDAVADKIRESIATLREYRAALISAAVTGKIDVRGKSIRG